MTLKELLGDAYKDGMTAEEITLALADRDLIERSEAETLANNRAAATKRMLDTANKKLAEVTKKNTDAGTENANLLERIAALEEDKKVQTRLNNIATYKASLMTDGYDDALATETATAMADGDMAKVLLNQSKFNAAQRQAMQEKQLKDTPGMAAGGTGTGAVDFAKAKADALNAGDDIEYMRLCREEAEQAAK